MNLKDLSNKMLLERKGSTPVELLTGKEQEKDWLELILDIVKQKDPSFLANSR